MIYVGIDPGLTGAVAVIYGEGVVRLFDCPTLKVGKRNQPDVARMADLIRDVCFGSVVLVGIERVHSMPGQGVASVFTFGFGAGVWHGILAALHLPYELVTPQAWKKVMMDGMPKEKDASRQRAQALFPDAELHLVKHHGRADALLIAEYVRRTTGQ